MLEKFIQLNNSQFGIRKRLTNEERKILILVLKMKNLRRLALVGGIAALSAVAFSPKAQAAPTTQDVTFSTTVSNTCTFSNTVNGALSTDSTNPWLVANPWSGTRATITVKCNSGGQVTVGDPVKTAAPAGFNDSKKQAQVSDGTNKSSSTSSAFDGGVQGFWSSTTTPLTIPANSDTTLDVSMMVGVYNPGAGLPPSGTYNYTVTLTATPN